MIALLIISLGVIGNSFGYIIQDGQDSNLKRSDYYAKAVRGTPLVFSGLCDKNISGVQNFDLERYSQHWHYVESYPYILKNGACRTADITLQGEKITYTAMEVVDERRTVISGVGKVTSEDGSGKYEISFPLPGSGEIITWPYYVLATDYTSYSLVYSCEDLVETEESRVLAWKLSRTKQLSEEASNAIDAAMANVSVLDQQYFEVIDQSEEACFYYPEPQEDHVVEFPGTCDDNVAVVPDFDLARFSNVWYEVEAYPRVRPFRVGQCISHNLTVDGDSISLETSQILDQQLDVESASLRYASDDKSGNLIFGFPHLGLNIPFWIISTDYDHYAIAYSCVQHGKDVRGIYSWKFSRTKVMSEESKAAISAAIADVDVLQQQYYNVIDQSNEACLLPDLKKDKPVFGRAADILHQH